MSFETALEHVLKNEGRYSNDPVDKGGETFRGIARNKWPNWQGWPIIDVQKPYTDFPQNLFTDPHLTETLTLLVRDFYKTNFWDTIFGDRMPEDVATKIFDVGVNMGPERPVSFLQRALNVLNRNQKLYPDIKVDGAMGPKTIQTLNDYLIHDSTPILIKIMSILQGMKYIDIMEKDSSQERFARGWINRLTI